MPPVLSCAAGSAGAFVPPVSGAALVTVDGATAGGFGQVTLPVAACGCGSGHGAAPCVACAAFVGGACIGLAACAGGNWPVGACAPAAEGLAPPGGLAA